MNYRDIASFGKRQEFLVISELLRKGFDVYLTLVDDQGIDCIIRVDECTYIDIQIKARSKEAKQWNFFAAMSFESRENFYFIFYTERNNTFWTFPSKDVVTLCHTNRTGKNAGKRHLTLPRSFSTPKAIKFRRYMNENGFALLREFKNAHEK